MFSNEIGIDSESFITFIQNDNIWNQNSLFMLGNLKEYFHPFNCWDCSGF